MGIFSSIIESVRDFTSNIIDTAINILGKTSDIISTEIERPYRGIGEDSFDYEDMFGDYIDWIHEAWY